MSAVDGLFTDEQRALRDAVRMLLAKRSDPAAVRRAVESPGGYDAPLWQTLCAQIGVAALGVPERFGGIGAGATELALVQQELGRTLTPSPMLGSAVHTVAFLLALGDDGACGRLLPRVAEGAVAAVAVPDADGVARHVLNGDLAEIVLVVDGDNAVEVDTAGTVRTHTPAMDLTRRLATVTLQPDARRTSLAGDAAAALAVANDAACVALAAEQIGAAARILEMTVAYSIVRHQFGRPIGSFQALKHRMADLHVRLEAARSAAWAAVAGEVHPSVAKAYCSEAFAMIAGEAIQLHGGIAITWEHDAHLYFKRAHGSGQLFGSPREHVARLGDTAGL